MAVSLTKLCNRALQRLGAARILTITDDTKNGRACNSCYETLRRKELRRHNWRFAITRVVLAPLVAAPAFDFDYQFPLPADYIKLMKPTLSTGQPDPTCDWEVESGVILTNNNGTTLNFRYVQDVTDVTRFDPLFFEALAMQMAFSMCDEITGSTNKQQMILNDYDTQIAEAKRINSFETVPMEGQEGSWLLSRNN